MKNQLITLLAILALTTPVCLAQTPSEADVTAIKKVIIDETDAFFTKNSDQWASYWAHEPYISWSAQGGAEKVLTQGGWAAYRAMFTGYFNNATPGPATTFQRENFQVTVVDKAATASYLQNRIRTDGNLKSREVRVLEKQGNDWRLVYVYSRNID